MARKAPRELEPTMSNAPVELVRQQAIGFDERGQRVVTEEYFIKLQYGFRKWIYSLSGNAQKVFLALAMREPDIAMRDYLPFTIYDIVEESKELTGKNNPTISLRGVKYAVKFLVAHNFIVKVGVRSPEQPHVGAIMYRVSQYAWFGSGNMPLSMGSGEQVEYPQSVVGGGVQTLHTYITPQGVQKSAQGVQKVAGGVQNPARGVQKDAGQVCKIPRTGVQKDARGVQNTPNHNIDDIDSTSTPVQNKKQKEAVRKKTQRALDENEKRAWDSFRSFGMGGRNLRELAESVSAEIAEEWALCARHTDFPLGDYQGICYNSLMSDPTAPPPNASPRQLAAWREAERLEAEQVEQERAFVPPVTAPGMAAEPIPIVDTAAEQMWQAVLDELQLQMTKATFDTWVKPTFALHCDLESATIAVGVRNAYAKQWLEGRLSGLIERAIARAMGKPATVLYVLKPYPALAEVGR